MTERDYKHSKIVEEIEKLTCENKLTWTRTATGDINCWETIFGDWKVTMVSGGGVGLSLSDKSNTLHITINPITQEFIYDIINLVKEQEQGMGGICDKILTDLKS